MAPTNATLAESMGRILETGVYSDVAIFVGPDSYRFNVHKIVLGARSPVLDTMMQKRWINQGSADDEDQSDTEEVTTLHFPAHGVEAFRMFIKFLYTDVISRYEPLPSLLELMNMAHLYDVPLLLDNIVSLLKLMVQKCTRAEMDVCRQIFQSSRNIHQELSKLSYNSFERNIKFAAANDRYLNWDVETVRAVLRSESVDINEVDLFNSVLKWANHKTNEEIPRSERLPELIKLIRFPVIGMKTFAAVVVPTKVLSKDDTLQVLLHFADPSSTPTSDKTRHRGTKYLTSETIQDFEMLTKGEYSNKIPKSERLFAQFLPTPAEMKVEVDKAIVLRGFRVSIGGQVAKRITPEGAPCFVEGIVKEQDKIVGRAVPFTFSKGSMGSVQEKIQVLLKSPIVLVPGKLYHFFLECSKYEPKQLETISSNFKVWYRKSFDGPETVESVHIGKGVVANITYFKNKNELQQSKLLQKSGWICGLMLSALPAEPQPQPCVIT